MSTPTSLPPGHADALTALIELEKKWREEAAQIEAWCDAPSHFGMLQRAEMRERVRFIRKKADDLAALAARMDKCDCQQKDAELTRYHRALADENVARLKAEEELAKLRGMAPAEKEQEKEWIMRAAEREAAAGDPDITVGVEGTAAPAPDLRAEMEYWLKEPIDSQDIRRDLRKWIAALDPQRSGQ